LNIRKVITADQSPTLYVPELNENYGSLNGAYNESMHVFISEGLRQIPHHDISILEIGFGTGLNTLLTYLDSLSTEKQIYYETIEKFPLDDVIIADLASESVFHNEIFKKLHRSPWNIEHRISENFTLKKIRIDFLEYQPSRLFNLIYFDAFAPEKQPELWTKSVFETLFAATLPGGILVTYSSKGTVKQALRIAGYSVSRIKGPEGKHHIVRAIKEVSF
jgi:tRNA U34 5-methylaminomethyl-2-thiouridine-forming methyltransferase MnmC